MLLGADPPVVLTRRATSCLAKARDACLEQVHPGATLVVRGKLLTWWTWAGNRANATLAATLGGVAVPGQRANDRWIRLREDVTPAVWKQAVADAKDRLCLPDVDERAVRGLKFAEALPPRLAEATLALRLADLGGARAVLDEPVRLVTAVG